MSGFPLFTELKSAEYIVNQHSIPLDATVLVADEDVVAISYTWHRRTGQGFWEIIQDETSPFYVPPTNAVGVTQYRVSVSATRQRESGLFPENNLNPSNSLYPDVEYSQETITQSSVATITIVSEMFDYMRQIKKEFTKLCRLRFLQPDGSTAFAIDNNPLNRRSGAFIANGQISGNLQNGQRRTATVTLSNLDEEYEFNVNKLWFGNQIAIDEGLYLSDGREYYIQQGVFYISDPQERLYPNEKTVTLPLVDKWAYLDGSLYGRLEATYKVPVGENVFAPIAEILRTDKGNGYPLDEVLPIFTDYYNNITYTAGSQGGETVTASAIETPYTLMVDSESGTFADVILGLNEMINGIIGYDASGALRIDPSQDDISDVDKPILWSFSMEETSLQGMTYTNHEKDVYNDYIVIGGKTSSGSQVAARAQNLDPSSDTNVNIIGRKTFRESKSGYMLQAQCKDYAEWKLKRSTVLQKTIDIDCIQMFHIFENNLVEIIRNDKPGNPSERHLIQSYSRPLATTGNMTISAISVLDFPNATITTYPS